MVLIKEVLCSNSRIHKVLRDILLSVSFLGSTSNLTTSDSNAKAVRNIGDSQILSKWDEIISQLQRAELYFFFLSENNSELLELGATAPKKLRHVTIITAVEDEDLADLLHVRDEKADNTDGGTFTTGAWQTRDLNTVKTNEIAGASLASDQITLPAGTYFIRARAPAFIVGSNVIKLRDITGATDLIIGSVTRSGGSGDSAPDSVIWGRFTLSVQSDLEIQHRGQATRSTDGFGNAAGVGVVEVYTEVDIRKIS